MDRTDEDRAADRPPDPGMVRIRAIELAEQLEWFSTVTEKHGWALTSTKMRQVASSLRWQVNWEQKHA